MKKHRLNIILGKCSNRKFKNGFIKYLRTLDFDEFEILFNYYTSIITRLMFRYKEKKEIVRIFSKKWFRNEYLLFKYKLLNLLFNEANSVFVDEINEKLKDNNKKISDLLIRIREINNSISIINNAKIEFKDEPSEIDTIKLIAILIEHIYNKNELNKLMEEINKLSK